MVLWRSLQDIIILMPERGNRSSLYKGATRTEMHESLKELTAKQAEVICTKEDGS